MGYQVPGQTDLLGGDALRRELKALAGRKSDRGELRKEALALIKSEFAKARECVRVQVLAENLPGQAAARALSAIQDAAIQVLYDFAVKSFYPAKNPTTSEHITVVATGGYGRGELAPGSDVDLLFVRPYKQTAWGESVIEFMLYMLWDLGLKVGHATRSLPECVRLGKQDITIRTALLEARYLTGDEKLYEELRKKFWSGIAVGSGQDFVEQKLAERDERHLQQGESRYLVEPNIKEGKGASITTTFTMRRTSSSTTSSPRTNTRPSRRRRPSCGMCACGCIISPGAPKNTCRSTRSPSSPPSSASPTKIRAAQWKISCAPTSWSPKTWAI